ncbi:hypothetical protein F5890DRAFT_663794 [Lentinula detonsa]|uniref:Glutamine amidotransferase type-2 domain-containing protein n=1 Tax=Lentinula detonsa TaxID=2804962 RepID=A0AA38UV02_9AGAR|nr:hypothetical protein F5890DRAFT_663794 [Lentinula detonsa]
MCRWIVYVGEQPLMLEDLLIKPKHSIVKQVSERFIPGLYFGLEEEDEEELKKQANWINVHGFGVSWYTDTLTEFDPSIKGMLPAQFRTIAPISTDLAFEQLCKHTASKCTLAHIRDASFPPVVEVNNHPFIFGKYSFMHNGSVDSFSKIRYDVIKRIFDLQTIVQTNQYKSSAQDSNYVFGIAGNTDTEHLAALYFAHLDIIQAMEPSFGADSTYALLLALIQTITDIHEIQSQHQVGPFTPGPGAERVGNTLNLCISMYFCYLLIRTEHDNFCAYRIADGGVKMLVSRWRDSKEGHPRSLYLSLTAGEKLNRKYTDSQVRDVSIEDVNNAEVKNVNDAEVKNVNDAEVEIDSVKELVARYKPTQQGCHIIVGSEPSTCDVQDWGLFDQNQCVTVDDDRNLRMIDLAKFFQPGREHEFEAYHFTEVIDKINNLNPSTPYSAAPAYVIDLPESIVFEKAFNLNAPAK